LRVALGGWRQVKQEVFKTWHDDVEAGGKVSYTPTKPTMLSQPPAMASMKGMSGIGISWQSGDVDEVFCLGQQDSKKPEYTMPGKLTGLARKITTERMMILRLL